MKTFFYALLFALVSAVMVASEPLFGLGLAGLVLVKGALLKGAIIGGALSRRGGKGRRRGGKGRRHGREAVEAEVATEKEVLDQLFLQATLQDKDDCAKKFLCLVNARDAAGAGLDAMERNVASLFESEKGFIDASSPTARFQLAAVMGRVAGDAQCHRVYAACNASYRDMAKFMEAVPAPRYDANLV